MLHRELSSVCKSTVFWSANFFENNHAVITGGADFLILLTAIIKRSGPRTELVFMMNDVHRRQPVECSVIENAISIWLKNRADRIFIDTSIKLHFIKSLCAMQKNGTNGILSALQPYGFVELFYVNKLCFHLFFFCLFKSLAFAFTSRINSVASRPLK